MASYSIDNGNVVTVTDSEWPDLIDKMEVKNGVLNIKNDSDDIKLLQFDDINISVHSFGELNIVGKLVKVYTANGELAQEFDLPIPGHSIGGVFVKNPETEELEIWRNISGGKMDFEFSDFTSNTKSGRIFKIVDNKIQFTDTDDGGVIPYENAEVYIPNIIVSTKDGDGESSHARFSDSLGGKISINNVAFSNFTNVYSDLAFISIKNTSLLKSINMYYVNRGILSNLIVSNDSSYSSGISISYVNNLTIDNIHAQSVKSYGVNIAYVNNIKINSAVGYLIKRDSSSDAAINLNTVQDFNINNIEAIGGMVYVNNSSNGTINNVEALNNIKNERSSSYSQPNIKVDSSANITIKKIHIPENGSAYDSFVNVLNSSKIDIIGVEANDDYANYLVRCDVAYDCKFVDISAKDVRSDDTVRADNKSNKLLFQNLTTNNKRDYKIYSKNTQVKGVYSDKIILSKGATNTTTFQMYDDDNSGKIFINFIQSDDIKVIEGNPKFDYTSGVLLSNKDVFDYQSSFVFRGIQFKDEDVELNPSNSKIRVLFSVKTSDVETDFKLLTKENLLDVNEIINNKSFLLTIRVDAKDLDDGDFATLNNLTIKTSDDRFNYPIYFKRINIIFDELVSSDNNAKFSLMYKDSYKSGEGFVLSDKNGDPIAGNVDGKKMVSFEYDYMYNEENNREPNSPFDVVLVVTGRSTTEPVVIYGEINENIDSTFTINSRPDKAYMLFEKLKNNN